MSAETISALPRPCAPLRRGLLVRPVAGMLADGTVFYAPIGEIVTDGPLVICHLCGRSLRSVTAHLRVHGWTKEAYCEAFAGWTWRAISAESRQPQSWLRRHQAQPSSPRWVQPLYRDNVGCHPS
jgi:hypothetical protein